jgi:sulfur relay protein TusB/DsrH
MALFTVDSHEHAVACLIHMTDEDALLLIGNAVDWEPDYAEVPVDIPVYALKDDLDRRGLKPAVGVEELDFSGWVQLSEQHQQHVHWR